MATLPPLTRSAMVCRRPVAVWVGGPCNPAGEAEVVATLKAAGVPPASGVLRVGGARPGVRLCPWAPKWHCTLGASCYEACVDCSCSSQSVRQATMCQTKA